jgi:hypothetical protein
MAVTFGTVEVIPAPPAPAPEPGAAAAPQGGQANKSIDARELSSALCKLAARALRVRAY